MKSRYDEIVVVRPIKVDPRIMHLLTNYSLSI